MDLLKRSLAPIDDRAWSQIDEEAARVLKLNLAARRVVDFCGPHGWELAAVNTGRLRQIHGAAVEEVGHAVRDVQPLVELRSQVVLETFELDYAGRGAKDLDLEPISTAAERIARAEDHAVFLGFGEAGIRGIVEATPHDVVEVQQVADWPTAIGSARSVLRRAGIDGPYALVLGPVAYEQVTAEDERGFPLRLRIEEAGRDGGLVWAPVLRSGGLLVSMRGGDFELTVGQDFSIGYTAHDRTHVELYLAESFAFRVIEGKAAVRLRGPGEAD